VKFSIGLKNAEHEENFMLHLKWSVGTFLVNRKHNFISSFSRRLSPLPFLQKNVLRILPIETLVR
jgi:glutathione peroxidase-family protein